MIDKKELARLKEYTTDVLEASMGIGDYVEYVLNLLEVPNLLEGNTCMHTAGKCQGRCCHYCTSKYNCDSACFQMDKEDNSTFGFHPLEHCDFSVDTEE